MTNIIIRLLILAIVGICALLIIWQGKRFVEARRQRAFAAQPASDFVYSSTNNDEEQKHSVQILVFSSDDCRQCHQLQTPALRRVMQERGEQITLVNIDAPSSPELTERYQVLTVPTTVLLNQNGKVHAINYGFANTQKILQQVDDLLVTL